MDSKGAVTDPEQVTVRPRG